MRADQVSAAFGRVLREQRIAAGVSQEALALSADVDRTFVSQIERGIRQPTLTTLCKLARVWTPARAYRDRRGAIRVVCEQVSYENLVQRSFDKIRQASRGMPALLIRELDALTAILEQTTDPDQARVLMDQAAMIQRANLESVPEESDRADVESRYNAAAAVYARRTDAAESYP